MAMFGAEISPVSVEEPLSTPLVGVVSLGVRVP